MNLCSLLVTAVQPSEAVFSWTELCYTRFRSYDRLFPQLLQNHTS